MAYELDDKDKKILDILKEHGDYTTRQIARKTLLPATTIHNRIKKLKKEGIIKKFTLDLDKKKLGKNFLAIMLVSVDYKTLRELKKDQHKMAKEISFLPEVESVDVVTGGTDMVVRVRVKDVQEYDHFLLKKFQNLPGVDRTQSLVVIHER
jgi:Lrp/AsnC family transcriptional regulator, leucine-responsive regulatory protein